MAKKFESLKGAITMFKFVFFSVALVSLFIAASSEAYAQESPAVSGWVDVEAESSGSDQAVQAATLINISGNGKVGAYVWAQTGPGYHQAYVGPTFSPKSWIQVGAALGVERSGEKVSPRVGAFVYLGKGRISNITLLEGAGSGFWYKNQTSLSLPRGVTASLVSQRFAGTGPELEVKIPKTPFSVRTSVLGQDGGPTFKVALRLNF